MDWKDEYSVGIDEIDSQHKALLAKFSVIEICLDDERDWHDLHLELVSLRELLKYHFSFEEALMRMFAYGETDEHAQSHKYMIKALAKIEERLLKQHTHEELRQFLTDWLSNHIMGTDRDYCRWILANANVVKAKA